MQKLNLEESEENEQQKVDFDSDKFLYNLIVPEASKNFNIIFLTLKIKYSWFQKFLEEKLKGMNH